MLRDTTSASFTLEGQAQLKAQEMKSGSKLGKYLGQGTAQDKKPSSHTATKTAVHG